MAQGQTDRGERLRVLIVQLSEGYAGTERQASELAAGLSQRHDVAVVLQERPTGAHLQSGYDALRASVAPGLRLLLIGRSRPWFGLFMAILRFRPDVVHAHEVRSVLLACRCARWLGVPVIGTVHGRCTGKDVADCTALVARTEPERARLALAFPRETALIESWVMPWPHPNAARIACLRQELGLGHAFLFGCVGRLEKVTRMDRLIDAFAAAGLPQTRLVIIGDGPERAALEAQVARLRLEARVVLAPFRHDIRDCYAMFGRFVTAASFEPSALPLLEAAEQMVPIISTRTEAALELARHTPITLVPQGDVDALSAAMREALSGPTQTPPLKFFAFADRLPQFEALYRRSIAAFRTPA